MRSSLPKIVALALVSSVSAAAAQSKAKPDAERQGTPAWLPRALYLGTFVYDAAITPQVRVQWEFGLFEQRNDMLGLVVEAGGGYGVAFPDNAGLYGEHRMTYFYQHAITAGISYRGRRYEHFRWGIDLTTGPCFYGARFATAPTENRFTGIVDGRLRMGWDFGPVTLGGVLGYGSIYSKPLRSNAAEYTGGFWLGLFVDTWH